jgi:ATPase subunit of ABC transporter with duplicated ATPase domains
LNFRLNSGDRLAISGANGTGKTTLLRLILGQSAPALGTLYRADVPAIYMDQDYSLLDNQLTVYTQAQQYNTALLEEQEIGSRLNHFLFLPDDWNKPCGALSGGERMRLILCCLTISKQAPDIIILDEPTNNLDIRNTAILIAAVQEYKGTLIVVSHDRHFIEQVEIQGTIELNKQE